MEGLSVRSLLGRILSAQQNIGLSITPFSMNNTHQQQSSWPQIKQTDRMAFRGTEIFSLFTALNIFTHFRRQDSCPAEQEFKHKGEWNLSIFPSASLYLQSDPLVVIVLCVTNNNIFMLPNQCSIFSVNYIINIYMFFSKCLFSIFASCFETYGQPVKTRQKKASLDKQYAATTTSQQQQYYMLLITIQLLLCKMEFIIYHN